MRFVQAQFSLKYEPQIKIRRSVNKIEDFLEKYYGTPQTVPIPDEFAAEAPRIILDSKNGHSQISFSQISVDFTAKFDGEFAEDFGKTKEYVLNRLKILKELLENININQYYFCGITYNVHLDLKGERPIDYIKQCIGGEILKEQNLYEASQRIALVENDSFFVNQQIGTFREYQGKGNSIPNLVDFATSRLVAEGVNVTLDINNRYAYLCEGRARELSEFEEVVSEVYNKLEHNLEKWR